MRDAQGRHKIGVTECAIGRRYLVEVGMPNDRCPIRLVRAVEVCRSDAYRIEARIHRMLKPYRHQAAGTRHKEWFVASMRRCSAAVNSCLVD